MQSELRGGLSVELWGINATWRVCMQCFKRMCVMCSAYDVTSVLSLWGEAPTTGPTNCGSRVPLCAVSGLCSRLFLAALIRLIPLELLSVCIVFVVISLRYYLFLVIFQWRSSVSFVAFDDGAFSDLLFFLLSTSTFFFALFPMWEGSCTSEMLDSSVNGSGGIMFTSCIMRRFWL